MLNYPKVQILDHGYVQFVESWGSDERIVESARMSTDKGFLGWDKDEGFLKYLYDHKHLTPFEMAGMTLEIKAPIFVFREWHRHRTMSYNEMSARYIPLPDENYVPSVERLLRGANTATSNKQAQGINEVTLTEEQAIHWLELLNESYAIAQHVYDYGLKLGIPKELARLPVPVARYSRMRVSCNLRNWLAFLALREAQDAQYEIRVFANEVCNLIVQHFERTAFLYNSNKK